jgi:hypothetical protein
MTNIFEQYYEIKNIYSIEPKFTIDFHKDSFQAFCIYDNTQFGVMLNRSDLKYMDTDYLYFDVAIQLIDRLNKEITKYDLSV